MKHVVELVVASSKRSSFRRLDVLRFYHHQKESAGAAPIDVVAHFFHPPSFNGFCGYKLVTDPELWPSSVSLSRIAP